MYKNYTYIIGTQFKMFGFRFLRLGLPGVYILNGNYIFIQYQFYFIVFCMEIYW